MGCCVSSPYTKRGYLDPADFDEVVQWEGGEGGEAGEQQDGGVVASASADCEHLVVPLRTFGVFRNNSNVIPDDIVGLPSTHILSHIASDPGVILYEAEIDQGRAFRCLRPTLCLFLFPPVWVWAASVGVGAVCGYLNCDQTCCWVRKEYSTRTYFRVYINRIERNDPLVRHLWGYWGCGSWNADNVTADTFDRGAFGFRALSSGTMQHMFCLYPMFGGVVARQRCNCNGSLWPRMFVDCGGWWCDEWLCDACFCTYKYSGLADPDETAFACSIALQSYFEGRNITREDMDRCLEYWRSNISERTAPVARRRPVCCEPFRVPMCTGRLCYERWSHPRRSNPYTEESLHTEALREAYDKYDRLRRKQVDNYRNFEGPARHGTLCQMGGCRRIFGRRGVIFCTEGCCDARSCCSYKRGEPAPPFVHRDIDDDNDAARILSVVLGDPPPGVLYRRYGEEPTIVQNAPNLLQAEVVNVALPKNVKVLHELE